MEHDIPFGNSNRENGPTFLDFPLFWEFSSGTSRRNVFHLPHNQKFRKFWLNGKRPKLLYLLNTWLTHSYLQLQKFFANVLWKRFLCEREPHHAITWDFVHRFLIVTILGIRFWAPEQYSWRFIQIHVLLSLTWIGVSSLKPPNVIQLEIFFSSGHV